MSNAKSKATTISTIGAIGVALTSLLDLLDISDPKVMDACQTGLPFLSAILYEALKWLSQLLTPEAARAIKAGWRLSRAIKEVEKQLKDPSLSDEQIGRASCRERV